MIDIAERVQFLKGAKFFAKLSPDSLTQLASCLTTLECRSGEIIAREGVPADAMFLIRSGLVEVRKKDPATGIDFLVDQLGAGASGGEMSMLRGMAQTCTYTAVQQTSLFTMLEADFRNLLLRQPEVSLNLIRVLAEHLHDANKQVGIDFISLQKSTFDPGVVGLIPHALILLHKIVPVAFMAHNNAVTLAMVNPSNLRAFDDVRRHIRGALIEPRVCTEDDFHRFMQDVYPGLMGIEKL